MKKSMLSLIMLGFLSLISMQATPIMYSDIPEQIEKNDVPPNCVEIVLHGGMVYGTGPDSVEAFLCKNSVQVCFHQNFGYVNITLIGETGNMVYSGTVNTAVQQTVFIPLAGAPSGNYTLILNNVSGMAEGEFAK